MLASKPTDISRSTHRSDEVKLHADFVVAWDCCEQKQKEIDAGSMDEKSSRARKLCGEYPGCQMQFHPEPEKGVRFGCSAYNVPQPGFPVCNDCTCRHGERQSGRYHYAKRTFVSLIQTDLDLQIKWIFDQFS